MECFDALRLVVTDRHDGKGDYRANTGNLES